MKTTLNKCAKKSVVLSEIKLFIFRRTWRNNNKHNFTKADNCFNKNYVSVGNGTYGDLNVRHFGDSDGKLKIGHYCSIAPECSFLLGGEHRYYQISTYPFKSKYCGTLTDAVSKGDIIIDDDVWIGYGATIMSGVHIGQGAVIAAGAVVAKDIPPYAIVGGVPAKIIKYRFPPHIIEALLEIDYGKLTKEMVREHINDLYMELTDVEQLKWIPQK